MKGKEVSIRNEGITLIALVITIIVLLILAGVTIVTLTGDNGLLTKAGEAKNTSTEAEIGEKIKLAYQDYYMGQHTNPGYTFQSALDKIFGGNIAQVTGEGPWAITIGGKTYTLELNGTVTPNSLSPSDGGEVVNTGAWTQDGAIVTNTNTGMEYSVGATIYYDSGVVEYEGTEDNQGKWGILGVENGNLLIMSKENVAYVNFFGKQDCLTGGTTKLNNACEPFKNETVATNVRSVKVEDINKISGYTPEAPVTHTYTMTNEGYVKMDNEEPSQDTVFEDINGKTLPGNSPISVTANNYTYSTEGFWADVFLNDNYWLDTPCVKATTRGAEWGFFKAYGGGYYKGVNGFTGLYYSFGSQGEYNIGIRPVVTLKSNIQLVYNETLDGYTLQF